MTEATPSVRPIIENTGATATAAAETLMKTIAMDGNRINIPHRRAPSGGTLGVGSAVPVT